MAGESPAAVPFSSTGVELDVADGVLIPAGTNGLLFAGRDSTNRARFIAVDSAGHILASFSIAQPDNAVVTPVPQSVVTTTLLAANSARLGVIIYNNISNGFLFIKLGAGASPTDWSSKLAPGFAYELPFPAYRGQITGVWSVAGGGTAQVTETS